MHDDPRLGLALRFVRRRCPDLDDTELNEAAQNFLTYMDIIRRIYERVTAEKTVSLVDAVSDTVEPRNH